MKPFAHYQRALTAAAAALCCLSVQAQSAPNSLQSSVQKALNTNPTVTEKLNALKAAVNDVDVAKGALLPQVNLTGDVGRETTKYRNQTPERDNFSRSGIGLNINQVLWDGQAIRSEIDRLDHARQARYFEFVSVAEETALEATKAYIDVVRFRQLVALAEDNYVQHKRAASLLQARAKSGVGRGVDSEQAQARLALAEINLSTELTNLYDVSARYLRVIGEAPPAGMEAVGDAVNSKSLGKDAIASALARNAAITASIENLRAVQTQEKSSRSGFQPKVEARLRGGEGNNFQGNRGQKQEGVGEVVMTWNLFAGGSDQARVRRAANLINAAEDQRDKVCREVRLTTGVASQDILRYRNDLVLMQRNLTSIRNARDAYRQQFEIGQRSLLDLLNSENELYTAERVLANAKSDLTLANARVQASTNTLVSSLGLSRPDGGSNEMGDNLTEDGVAQRCPATELTVTGTSRADLDARAAAMDPAPVAAAPTPEPEAAQTPVQIVDQRLIDWAESWASKDFPKYLTFYGSEFTPDKSMPEAWRKLRERRVNKKGPITLRIENIKTVAKGKDVTTSFRQVYKSDDFKDDTLKTLTWRMVGGNWVIVKESNR